MSTGLTLASGAKIVVDKKTIPAYADDGQSDTSNAQGMMIFSAKKGVAMGADVTEQGLQVSLGSAISKDIDSITTYPRGSNYSLFTASGQIMAVAGKLVRITVASAAAGATIKVWDALTPTGTNVPLDTVAIAAKDTFVFDATRMTVGAYLTITGTATVHVYYDPTSTN